MYTEEKLFVPEYLVQIKYVVSATGSRSCTKFALEVTKDEVNFYFHSFFKSYTFWVVTIIRTIFCTDFLPSHTFLFF